MYVCVRVCALDRVSVFACVREGEVEGGHIRSSLEIVRAFLEVTQTGRQFPVEVLHPPSSTTPTQPA